MPAEEHHHNQEEQMVEEYTFDVLARSLAGGTLSRQKALKLVGAAVFGSTFGFFALPDVAQAKKKRRRRARNSPRTRQIPCGNNGGSCGPAGSVVCCPGGLRAIPGFPNPLDFTCCKIGETKCCLPPPESNQPSYCGALDDPCCTPSDPRCSTAEGGCCSTTHPVCCPEVLGGGCCPSIAPQCCPPEVGGGCCPTGSICSVDGGVGVCLGIASAAESTEGSQAKVPQKPKGRQEPKDRS